MLWSNDKIKMTNMDLCLPALPKPHSNLPGTRFLGSKTPSVPGAGGSQAESLGSTLCQHSELHVELKVSNDSDQRICSPVLKA